MRPIEAKARLAEVLDTAALDPEHLDVWEAWKAFKTFIREPVDTDDEGISVQAVREKTPDGLDLVYLNFLRQFTAIEGEGDAPIRYAGMELVYTAADLPLKEDVDVWSYDFPSFPDFAAHVEALPLFQQAAALRTLESSVVGGEI